LRQAPVELFLEPRWSSLPGGIEDQQRVAVGLLELAHEGNAFVVHAGIAVRVDVDFILHLPNPKCFVALQ